MILSRSGHQNYFGFVFHLNTERKKKDYIYLGPIPRDSEMHGLKQLLSRKHHAEAERTLRLKVANNMNFHSHY